MKFAVLLLQLALAQTPSSRLLDVPFVAQTPELCGGAAVSMVLRYWGLRDVFPQDFAPLVSQSDGGIFTGVLAKAVTDRGWNALVNPASSDTGRARLRDEIDRGRPLIALIHVAPRTFHYTVIAGITDNEVVFHDPARGAFRVMDWSRFNNAWSPAGYWMMVALPPDGVPARGRAQSRFRRRASALRVVSHGDGPLRRSARGDGASRGRRSAFENQRDHRGVSRVLLTAV